ncbi:unnamed protein product [Symbiodinium sp. CCMP2592]|nr:unnamed protein product [Symbiodinium sp. CCMP2592]
MDIVPAPAGAPDAAASDPVAMREDLQLLENLMNEVCKEWDANEELKARVFGQKKYFLWPGDDKGKKKQISALAVKLNKDLLKPIVGRCLQHSLLATVPMMEKMLQHQTEEWKVPEVAQGMCNKDARNMKTAVTCHRRLADRSDSQRDADVHELTAELRQRSGWVLARDCPVSQFYAIQEDYTKPRFSKSVRVSQGKGRGKGKRAKVQQPPEEDPPLVPLAPPEGEAADDELDGEQGAASSEAAEEVSDEDGHESQAADVGEEEPDPDYAALDLMMKEIDELPAPVLIEDSPMPGKDAPDGCSNGLEATSEDMLGELRELLRRQNARHFGEHTDLHETLPMEEDCIYICLYLQTRVQLLFCRLYMST